VLRAEVKVIIEVGMGNSYVVVRVENGKNEV
jgi:hypothetical protein